MANDKLPTFQKRFLKPKHWGFWLGVALWRLIVCLPYPILHKLGNGLGWLLAKSTVGQRRANIARRNLQLCFPHYSADQIETLLHANLKATGMAIIETGMAWFWSDARIKKMVKNRRS
ncbi:lipid A biosynthesis lauroyl acyltransferase [Pasteurella multocida]|nr:lipid A biosynthesis lauroyl acyltransferase [Pasteurella multocida]